MLCRCERAPGCRENWCQASSHGTTATCLLAPCRSRRIGTERSMRSSVSNRWRSSAPPTGMPSKSTMRSPAFTPARSAGLPLETSVTASPRSVAETVGVGKPPRDRGLLSGHARDSSDGRGQSAGLRRSLCWPWWSVRRTRCPGRPESRPCSHRRRRLRSPRAAHRSCRD